VGDLESQLLDYDNLIHLIALVVSAALVKQSFGAEQRNYLFCISQTVGRAKHGKAIPKRQRRFFLLRHLVNSVKKFSDV
jgi:hypothetical protein